MAECQRIAIDRQIHNFDQSQSHESTKLCVTPARRSRIYALKSDLGNLRGAIVSYVIMTNKAKASPNFRDLLVRRGCYL